MAIRGSLHGLLLGLTACAAAAHATPPAAPPTESAPLFSSDELLELGVHLNMKALCRDPRLGRCDDLPAELRYTDASGAERRVEVALRSRGRFRDETGNCTLPALFVFFTGSTEGTLFEGEKMLPLTTHCRPPPQYEQYVLKEYLAHRLYNALTEKSLRARLARITYYDTSGRNPPLTRPAFFTEHFDSLARRHGGDVLETERFDLRTANPTEVATLDLFQFMIGNTDWSAIFGHNIVIIRDAAGLATPVPYDFDFSGLVDAHYASGAPELRIRDVQQRVFRGVCRPDTDWPRVFAMFEERRGEIDRLTTLAGLTSASEDEAHRYLDAFFSTLSSASERERAIVGACRSPRPDARRHRR